MQMTTIENNICQLARWMYFLAGMAIVAMMMITTLDVFMRFCVTVYSKFGWAFLASWRPVPGTYDLVAMCGAIAAAFATIVLAAIVLAKTSGLTFAVTFSGYRFAVALGPARLDIPARGG